ncbi:tetratricopeptide repeat protein [Geothermobacter hydrogeniphilus]|uniref:Uncharacterized protein n=1 Tax=Geothermobacter hydrogeniphilus TaxID=1969733 RepID=A0A1X0YB20_9BACT|nr:hypothetical protein [Geothermobacter hydrogeniphilus]ORJ62368.1 hypothetical protein B5V00_03520 [Geothermobacter hydrogeniphilus]
MTTLLSLLLPILLLLSSTAGAAPATGDPAKPSILLNTPVATTLVETDTEALLAWRKRADDNPTLLLFSNDPFLLPIPETVKKDALNLVLNADAGNFRRRAVLPTSDPLLLPGMGVSAALEAGMFSRLIWVLPLDEKAPLPTVEKIREQLLNHGVLDKTEANRLKKVAGHFTGSVRGIPLDIYGSNNLPDLTGPLAVHIDLSFFSVRYRNEIRTPVYSLLGEDLKRWKQQRWAVNTVSISFGNLSGHVPLGIRFLGRDLKQILEHPAMLDDPLPRTWDLRARALYLENFFKKEEMLKIFNEMDRLEPDNPDVLYGLYQVQRRFKNGNAALQRLAEAVRLDPGYGLEYFTLADTAMEKKRPDAALQMLSLAAATHPESPAPLLRQMEILEQINRRQPMTGLLQRLKSMPWSKIYYAKALEQIQNRQPPRDHPATDKNR